MNKIFKVILQGIILCETAKASETGRSKLLLRWLRVGCCHRLGRWLIITTVRR